MSWKLLSKTHRNNGQYFWDTRAFQIDFLIIKIANTFPDCMVIYFTQKDHEIEV